MNARATRAAGRRRNRRKKGGGGVSASAERRMRSQITAIAMSDTQRAVAYVTTLDRGIAALDLRVRGSCHSHPPTP